jgi:hypothetical protein
MSDVNQEHLDFIRKAISDQAAENNVQLDDVAFGELVRRAKNVFSRLRELPNPQRSHFSTQANIAVEETFEDWLEEPEGDGPPVDDLADEVIRRRINGQSYETIATDLQIDGGSEGAKRIFYQHFQGFDIPTVRDILANFEACERVLIYLRLRGEKGMKPSELVEKFPEEVLELLKRYDNNVQQMHNNDLHLQGAQQRWLNLREEWTVEQILQNRPQNNIDAQFPGDLVVHVVTNRLQHIVGLIQQQLPDFGE